MARRLEGQEFNSAYNNGVSAIAHRTVREHAYRCSEIVKRLTEEHGGSSSPLADAIEAALQNSNGPIFTFASTERVAESPWFTGDGFDLYALLTHIEQEGGVIARSLYVPFSNGLELGFHGTAAQVLELGWVASGWQFFQTFGITLDELRARVAKR